MDFMVTVIHKLWHDEDAASATEYSVLILLIILVALVAISLLGVEVRESFNTFVTLMESYTS